MKRGVFIIAKLICTMKKSLLFVLILLSTFNMFSQSVENTTWRNTKHNLTFDLKSNGRAYCSGKGGSAQGEWRQNGNQITIKVTPTNSKQVVEFYGTISINTMEGTLKHYVSGGQTLINERTTLYSNNYNSSNNSNTSVNSNSYNNSNSTNNYGSNTNKEYLEEQKRAEEEFQRKMQAEQKKKEEFQQMQAEIEGLFKTTNPQNNSSFKSLNTNSNANSTSQFKTFNSQSDRPQVELNKRFLSPAQKESELNKSKIAYNLAVEKINNYEKKKTTLEEEINDLTVWIEKTNKLIFEYQKDSAKLYYQETIVWYEATNHGTAAEQAVVTKVENDLKNIYDLSDKEIKQLRDVAETDFKKGVPTLTTVKSMEETGDAVDESLKAGTYIAAGIIEGAYSKVKHERAEIIKKLKGGVKSYKNSIDIKQQQIIDITIEYNNLQNVFDKYGYDIINDTDEYHIIDFGNACRNALNIRIE